jgi:hypothetical protein
MSEQRMGELVTAATEGRRRGRPPRIDTPEEARIRAILHAIKNVKDKNGRLLFLGFEKLPDEEQYPDYYKEIKRPIALNDITVLQLERLIVAQSQKACLQGGG